MQSIYATLPDLKTALKITSTTYDDILHGILEAASRVIDQHCARFFYSETASKTYDGHAGNSLRIDDLISLTSIKTDTTGDGTFDQTWESDEYILYPLNKYPKTEAVAIDNLYWPNSVNSVQVTGIFGYGDGTSSNYKSADVTGDVNESSNSLTLSAAGTIAVGHTLLLDSEQVLVIGLSGTTATVTRAINGTTAASHSSATVYIQQYPKPISTVTKLMAIRFYKAEVSNGLNSEQIEGYAYQADPNAITATEQTLLDPYRRFF